MNKWISNHILSLFAEYRVKKVWWPYVTLFACIFSGLRIRIHQLRIRIQCGSGSRGIEDQNKFTCEKNYIFILTETTIYLFLGLQIGRPSYKRCLSLKKKIWPSFPRIIELFTLKKYSFWIRVQGSKRPRIRIRNTLHCCRLSGRNQEGCIGWSKGREHNPPPCSRHLGQVV